MRPFCSAALIYAALPAIGLLSADSVDQDASRIRVGVYDNRAIAIAYAPSQFNPVAEKMAEYRKAKDSGDTARAAELEAWGKSHQRQLHRQGFSRVPVDDLLAHVKDQLPEVAAAQNVDIIAMNYDYAGNNVEIVDITDALVQLFNPSPKTLKWAQEIRDKHPVPLEELENHKD